MRTHTKAPSNAPPSRPAHSEVSSSGREPAAIRHSLSRITIGDVGSGVARPPAFSTSAPIQLRRKKKKFRGTKMSLGEFHAHVDREAEIDELHPEVAATIRNANNILRDGVLTRSDLAKKGVKFTGSVDKGESFQNDVSVNLLRTTDEQDADEVAEDSVTAADRGSLSVALERPNDEELMADFAKPPLTAEEEEQLQGVPEGMRAGLRRALLSNTLPQPNANATAELSRRAQRSVLAITTPSRLSGGRSATRREQIGDFKKKPLESRSEERQLRGSIRPGSLHSLVVPESIRDHAHLLHNPHKVPIRFVGNKSTDVHFKPGDGQRNIPVTIDAPDFGSAVSDALKDNPRLLTHVAR
ncbi:MAG: hypothetical protein AAF799_03975 [Myxococcota bacterium]